jgi:hypothetical protein
MLASGSIHTTGVNWELVSAVVTCVVLVMTAVFSVIAKLVTNQISGAINRFRIEVIAKMDNRLTILEQIVADDKKGRK